MHYLLHKIEARNLVKDRLVKWSIIIGCKYKSVSIKKLKSRWGSCSSDKRLNFNYKIMFLPEDMQDYLIVHELCHLEEMNHSKKFWALVGDVFPDYQKINRLLRKI
jgi:predicted metal-dependent hydrolase